MCVQMQFKALLAALAATLMAACGTSESVPGDLGSSAIQAQNVGRAPFLAALNPLFLAFDKNCPGNPNPNTCNTIVATNRVLGLNQYDAVIEPNLSSDSSTATTVVTGIGVEAVHYLTRAPLNIRLGVVGRQYDFSKRMFTNNTRIFSAPGESFDGAQDFTITNAVSTNIFMTGLGFRLYGGSVTKLELQRKPLSRIGEDGDALTASTRVSLANGWVAVGFLIRVLPSNNSSPIPFMQDVLMYTAQLR